MRNVVAGQPDVVVSGLSVAYVHENAWQTVVDKVNFSIQPGEVFGLVGESGCGKSTVAYALLGYCAPGGRITSGKVVVVGSDVLTMRKRELSAIRGKHISFVPQNPTTALSPHMRVGTQIAEVLVHHGVARDSHAARARTQEVLSLVGLPRPEILARRYPHELSGGQQQRVVIAMALSCNPRVLVLDEPTTGLDVTTQRQILSLLAYLRQRIGLSMLYVTHDLAALAQLANRVGVMYAGRLVEIASVNDLFERPLHPYTQGLIGSIPSLANVPRRSRLLSGLFRRADMPAGCAFAPRCQHAETSCHLNQQLLEAVSGDREIACQRWRSLLDFGLISGSRDSHAAVVRKKGDKLLAFENVTIRYSPSNLWSHFLMKAQPAAVHEVSFDIQPGETLALVGESGSGKSTIARAIAGLITPHAGAIYFRGGLLAGDVRKRSRELRRQIQYIFQNPDASLNPRTRIGNILLRPVKIFMQQSTVSAKARVLKSLEEVSLDGSYVSRYSDQLSGGERQRVALARAVSIEPDLLLCDEVLSALDVSVQANILELLARLKRDTNVAVLFISHDLAVVRALAGRVAVIYRGRIMELGDVDEIFNPPYHPYTLSLLRAVPDIRNRVSPRVGKLREVDQGRTEGCVFAGQCPCQVDELCEKALPPRRQVGRSLSIWCHRDLGDLISLASAVEPNAGGN